MIVDLLRNDIGRVAVTGSVLVSDLCALERYPTVWQLTSRIDATLRPGLDLLDLLRAMFPCGSITGAPKVRTMEIIASLESSPRGIYTGAVCLLQPGGDMVASVPIRTAVLDRAPGVATFNVGAGITADSDGGGGVGRVSRQGPRRAPAGRARGRRAVRDASPRGGTPAAA